MAVQLLSAHKSCTSRCRSSQHFTQLSSCLSKATQDQTKLYWLVNCRNFWHLTDGMGRSFVHWTAARGKEEILEWLIEKFGADFSIKDLESGYTPLHVALLHGQITTTQTLIDQGAVLAIPDREGLTCLDIIHKDRLFGGGQFSVRDPTEVYSFGENASFTLGHTHPTPRTVPEPVDFFRRLSLSINKVSMSKFHTLFLTKDGRVFSCGHGLGGRLGVGTEITHFSPQIVTELKSDCVDIAAATDHSVFVDEKGIAYTCGSNKHGQLGLGQSVTQVFEPQPITIKNQKSEILFVGCVAGQCHTVLWTSDMTLYTFGLNFGQLALPKDTKETIIWLPRKAISYASSALKVDMKKLPLMLGNCSLEFALQSAGRHQSDDSPETKLKNDRFYVSSSDGALVIATPKGDVFVLSDYEKKRIASKQLDLKSVHVTGGGPFDQSAPKGAGPKENQQIKVVGITVAGGMWVWYEEWPPIVKKVFFHGLGVKIMDVVDCALSQKGLFLVTEDGNAFKANFSTKSKDPSAEFRGRQTALCSQLLCCHECHQINLTGRMSNVHRCVQVFSDPSGRNATFVQSDPSTDLTQVPMVSEKDISTHFGQFLIETQHDDILVDLTIRCGPRSFPVHKYIVFHRSTKLKSEVMDQSEWSVPEMAGIQMDPLVFEHFLEYLYTDWCELLQIGFTIGVEQNISPEPGKSKKKKKKKSQASAENKSTGIRNDPIRQLSELAKKLGVICLQRKLESVKWEPASEGLMSENVSEFHGIVVAVPHKKMAASKLSFSMKSLPSLHDVVLRCTDDMELYAHRCILAARLDYFRSMLCTGWMESNNNSTITLSLPVPGDIGKLLLHFLYTDDLPEMSKQIGQQTGEVPEALCRLLIAADHLLIGRLREICESAIARLVSLRNAVELLQFAQMYNADQLGQTCLQFICLNLSSFLDANALQGLDTDILDKIGQYYRNTFDHVGSRILTPSQNGPNMEQIQTLWAQFESMEISLNELAECVLAEHKNDPTMKKIPQKVINKQKIENKKETLLDSSLDTSYESIPSPVPTTTPKKSTECDTQIINQPKETTPKPKSAKFKLFKQELTSPSRPEGWVKLKPWGTVETTSSPVDETNFVSLRDVMEAEQKAQTNILKQSPKVVRPTNTTQRPASVQSPKSWFNNNPNSPTESSASLHQSSSFSEIVREEEGKMAEREKQENRPLMSIQLEEEAIQQLLFQYGASMNLDEFITVERVAQHKAAAPVWKAHVHK